MVSVGECEHSLSPMADMLRKHGIRPILNYAAEDDVTGSPAHVQCADTAAEQLCDRNMLPFLKSIEDSASRPGKGFVAAKVSPSTPYSHMPCGSSKSNCSCLSDCHLDSVAVQANPGPGSAFRQA